MNDRLIEAKTQLGWRCGRQERGRGDAAGFGYRLGIGLDKFLVIDDWIESLVVLIMVRVVLEVEYSLGSLESFELLS